jgi:hypothetical protein
MRPFTLAILLLAASSALGKPAKVERKPRRFAVRAIHVGGNAGDDDRATLAREVGNAIEFVIAGSNRDDLVRAEEGLAVEAAHPGLKGCLTARCNLEFGDLVHAERLLWIDIARSGGPGKGDWKVTVSQFAVDSLRSLGSAELPCAACSREDLVGAINRFLDPLFKNEPPPLPLCKLKVVSRPPGATVLVGGEPVGEAPFEHTLSAGRHRVAVEKPGFMRSESSSARRRLRSSCCWRCRRFWPAAPSRSSRGDARPRSRWSAAASWCWAPRRWRWAASTWRATDTAPVI